MKHFYSYFVIIIQLFFFHQFNPASHATPKSPGFKRDPELQDKVHTVAFVIDASTINVINTAVIHQMKEIQSLIIERGKIFFMT